MTATFTRRLAVAAVVIAVLVALVLLLDRTSVQVDLTAEHSNSLAAPSAQVARAVHSPVRIYAFLARTEGGRAEAAALLNRYRRLNTRISFRVIDPADAPGQVRHLGVDPVFGGVAATQAGRVQRAPTASEQDITSVLARLERNVTATICFTAGHGERAVTETVDGGLSDFQRLLEDNGYKVATVDLLTAGIGPECTGLVVADPSVPLGDKGAVVGRWLKAGGRALILDDPDSAVDLNPLLVPFGLQVKRGLVLEGSDGDRLPGDPVTPIISHLHSGFPFVRRIPPLVMPTAQAVVADETGTEHGLIASGFAATTRLAYLETEPSVFAFDPKSDVAGPLDVAGASQVARSHNGKVTRTRLAVIGDVDLATNAVIGQAGNGRLLVQLTDWLTLDEDLVTVPTNVALVRPLVLTSARLRYARTLTAGLVPLAFLLAGAMVWAVRRPR